MPIPKATGQLLAQIKEKSIDSHTGACYANTGYLLEDENYYHIVRPNGICSSLKTYPKDQSNIFDLTREESLVFYDPEEKRKFIKTLLTKILETLNIPEAQIAIAIERGKVKLSFLNEKV